MYKDNCATVSPDAAAIEFYAMNHAVSVVLKNFTKNEPLPDWAVKVVKQYVDILRAQTLRNFHYMMCIITREARHLKVPDTGNKSVISKWVIENYGLEMWEFLKTNATSGNESFAVSEYCLNPPNVSVGMYVSAITHIFNNGKWSGGYGGKPWGNISQTVQNMIEGKYSLEMMVDTAYTLAHNNGPMYNKGMMYDAYTSKFIQILDIQRSGQIPEWIFEYALPATIKPEVKVCLEQVKKNVPGAFGPYMSWIKVEASGSVKKYPVEVGAEKIKHKVPDAPVLQTFNGKTAKLVGSWSVTPGQTVTIVERIK